MLCALSCLVREKKGFPKKQEGEEGIDFVDF